MVEYCYNKTDYLNNSDDFSLVSCVYNNTIFYTNKYENIILGAACTTLVSSTFIFLYAVYVIHKAYKLPNKSFFLLILGFIIVGTISGTYSVFLQYRGYQAISSLPAYNVEEVRCILVLANITSKLKQEYCPLPKNREEALQNISDL
jgi:hypothetical protein